MKYAIIPCILTNISTLNRPSGLYQFDSLFLGSKFSFGARHLITVIPRRKAAAVLTKVTTDMPLFLHIFCWSRTAKGWGVFVKIIFRRRSEIVIQNGETCQIEIVEIWQRIAIILLMVDSAHFLDWSGRRRRLLENAIAFPSCGDDSRKFIQCPAGVRGRGDPAGAKALRRLPGTPAESEAAWSGNQQSATKQPS